MSEKVKMAITSLSDFASTNTDDVSVLKSRLAAAGTFIVRGQSIEVSLQEKKDVDQDDMFVLMIKSEILQATPNDDSLDPESFEGRVVSERYVLWPSDMEEAIGLLKGRFVKVGLGTDGNLGGVEGEPAGWLDTYAEHPHTLKIRHATTKNGDERAYFDWNKLEDPDMYEALGVPNPFVEAE